MIYEPTDVELDREAYLLAADRARRQTAARKPHETLAGVQAAARARAMADPTAILNDEPAVVAHLREPWPATHPSFDAFYETLIGFAQALAETFERAAEIIGQFLASPAAEELRLLGVDEDANRRRHGSASICPRHGETEGGLCRRCRR